MILPFLKWFENPKKDYQYFDLSKLESALMENIDGDRRQEIAEKIRKVEIKEGEIIRLTQEELEALRNEIAHNRLDKLREKLERKKIKT